MINIGQIIQRHSIKIFFQVILLPMDAYSFSVESFVRGVDPLTQKIISPGELFAAAHQEGLSEQLDQLCICKTIETFKPIADQNPKVMLHININISFFKAAIESNYIEDCAKKYGLSTDRIVIDIDNLSIQEDDLPLIHHFIKYHREKGFYISIDDIGKNYNNIDKIMLFNPDIIKLNQQMLNKLVYTEYTKLLVEYITSIAHRMGILVIATGVESKVDLEKALRSGAQMIQGYYVSPTQAFDYNQILHVIDLFDYESALEITNARYEKDDKSVLINIVNFNSHLKSIFEHIDTKDLIHVMKDLLNNYAFIESSYFLDDRGVQISDSFINKSSFGNRNKELFGLYPKGFSHENEEYFTRLLNPLLTDWVTKPYRSRLSNDVCATTSFKITNRSGNTIVVVLNYNYLPFDSYISAKKPKIKLFED
jgi:EAL domain-containing protein (putative c-di-GMP-specific phosphodiesterase class I)